MKLALFVPLPAAGVPQGSALDPILYLLFTADFPCTEGRLVATYTDKRALLDSHKDSDIASKLLKNGLDIIHIWTRKWKTRQMIKNHCIEEGKLPSCDPQRKLSM